MKTDIHTRLFGRLADRPIHLYAEPVSSEYDGIRRTRSKIILYAELTDRTVTLPISADIPDGKRSGTVIVASEDGSVDIDALCDNGYAIFTVNPDTVLGRSNGHRRELVRLLSRGISRNAPGEISALAWVILRVSEYISSTGEQTGEIFVYDTVADGLCALLAAIHDERLSCATVKGGFDFERDIAELADAHPEKFARSASLTRGYTAGMMADALGKRVCDIGELIGSLAESL